MRDSAVPWNMSMAMLSRPSWPSLLLRKVTRVPARLALLLMSSVFGVLVGLPGSTCETTGGQVGPSCLKSSQSMACSCSDICLPAYGLH